MEFQRICLVHYHEIGLKGHNRASFELRLLHNLQALLEGLPIERLTRISGRILVILQEGATLEESHQALKRMKDVPGVARSQR